jgi:hypothetical protein
LVELSVSSASARFVALAVSEISIMSVEAACLDFQLEVEPAYRFDFVEFS